MREGYASVFQVVLFSHARGGVAIDRMLSVDDAHSAVKTAERLHYQGIAGSIAYARTGSAETGEMNEPVELARYGNVPNEVFELI